jgi:hypothetical protein
MLSSTESIDKLRDVTSNFHIYRAPRGKRALSEYLQIDILKEEGTCQNISRKKSKRKKEPIIISRDRGSKEGRDLSEYLKIEILKE